MAAHSGPFDVAQGRLRTRDSGLERRSQNLRTGLILAATLAALFVGSVLYIILHHAVR